MSFAFPKSRRLRKRADIVSVQRTGNAIHSRYFVVVCAQGQGRLGITVSKKVGNAVNRNRVKRLVREFARTSKLRADLDVVVIAKKHAAAADTAAIWNDLDSLGPAMSNMAFAEQGRTS